jgi:hypothetical protein
MALLRWPLPSSFAGNSNKEVRYTGEKRIYHTVRIKSTKPKIDGKLDDACWIEGEWAGNFREHMPLEGGKPSQNTEVKILHDEENIYVAFRCYDSEPDKTDRQKGHRDEFTGDIAGINFDSYYDHRTGFEFNLTAGGSKIDLLLTNEKFDVNWNPVWDGAVGQMDSGWIAEMQIPFSQLRYNNQDIQVWGLHCWRWLNRNKEEDQWNLIPRDNGGPLYYFGELHGLNGLPAIRRMEFMPYTLGKIRTYKEEEGNPFADGKEMAASLGLDGKLGIGSNFTVDYTLNPDFGQVEADPSNLNLTAFETYYEEKRPYFMEGSNIFDYSIDDNQLFYSRRIGHKPLYEPPVNEGEYLDLPDNTSILGAVKLTGKTSRGLSLGIMENLTSAEYAKVSSPEGDRKIMAEPLTNYIVARLQQDIDSSNAMIGGMMTSTLRDLNHHHLNSIAERAITGGLDFQHYLKNKTYKIDLKTMFSSISGSPQAISLLQKESSRYYQRPDADHLSLDTTLTKFTGHGGSLAFNKLSNGKWRYGIGTQWASPGLELNDIGFQLNADLIEQNQSLGFVENTPGRVFRTFSITLNESNHWNFGGEYLYASTSLNMFSVFTNKWFLFTELTRQGKTLNTNLLRGGPGVFVSGETRFSSFMNTDDSKKIFLSLGYFTGYADRFDSYYHNILTQINWKLSHSFLLSPELMYSKGGDKYQYIANESFEHEGLYLLGQLERETYKFTLRLNYAVTPELSLQYYGSPYITMGKYKNFRYLAHEQSKKPAEVFGSYSESELSYDPVARTYQLTEDPFLAFENPDFNFREFRSNLVARWEYKPGSALFVVWTNNQSSWENITNHDFGYNFRQLFSSKPTNIFLIKFSYWFSV